MIEAASPDNRYWIAATGLNLAASLSLTSNVTAAVASLSLELNQYGGTDSSDNANTTPLNWTQFNPEINPGASLPSPVTLTITYGAQAQVTLGGRLTNLNIFNLFKGSADFGISDISPVTVTPPTGPQVTDGTLITVGLSNIVASAGTGGFGLSISGGDLGLAIIEPPAPAMGTDSRYWIAVDATGIGASLNLGGISASVMSLGVQANQFGGTDASGNPTSELNWMSDITVNGTTYTVDPGANISPAPPSSLAITYSATSPALSVSATGAQVNIFNLLTGSANFTLTQSTTNVSFTGSAPASLVGASLVQVSFSDLDLSLGTSSFGLTISDGAIGVAAIQRQRRPRAATAATGSPSPPTT